MVACCGRASDRDVLMKCCNRFVFRLGKHTLLDWQAGRCNAHPRCNALHKHFSCARQSSMLHSPLLGALFSRHHCPPSGEYTGCSVTACNQDAAIHTHEP